MAGDTAAMLSTSAATTPCPGCGMFAAAGMPPSPSHSLLAQSPPPLPSLCSSAQGWRRDLRKMWLCKAPGSPRCWRSRPPSQGQSRQELNSGQLETEAKQQSHKHVTSLFLTGSPAGEEGVRWPDGNTGTPEAAEG